MIKRYKKIVFIILIIVILFGVVIFCRKPSYGKIKENLKLTKYIVVYDLTADKELKEQINDTKIIKEITTILSKAKIDNSKWETPTADKYRLEFYDNDKKIIIQTLINTKNSNPLHIKYKNHNYSLKLKQIELLNTVIDNYLERN